MSETFEHGLHSIHFAPRVPPSVGDFSGGCADRAGAAAHAAGMRIVLMLAGAV
jgi:hypothetical protein